MPETKMNEIAKLETCKAENCMTDKVSKQYKETKQLPYRAYPDHSLCVLSKGSVHDNKMNNCFNTSVKMPTSPLRDSQFLNCPLILFAASDWLSL